MAKKGATPPPPWGYVLFEENEHAPARDWLLAQSPRVRKMMLDTLDFILAAQTPPRAFLPNRWASMKDIAGVDMSSYHEARDKHGDTLYRLFCRFDSSAEQTKLGARVLVILDGRTKPVREPLDPAEYKAIKALWPRYYQPTRRCTPVEYPPIQVKAKP
jgi:hypothetical protein